MNTKESIAVEFQKYLDNVKNGKNGFQLVTCGPKGCLYYSDGFSGQVTTAIACMWNRAGIILHHEVTEGKVPPDDGEFTAIIKKRRKLLLADKDAGYFTFGTTDVGGADATRTLLYFQCNGIATFIVASSDMPEIHIVDDLQDSDMDPLYAALHDLLSHMPAGVQRGEVNGNGGSEEKGDI